MDRDHPTSLVVFHCLTEKCRRLLVFSGPVSRTLPYVDQHIMDGNHCHLVPTAKLCIPTSLLLAILDLIGSEHVPNMLDQDQSIYFVDTYRGYVPTMDKP